MARPVFYYGTTKKIIVAFASIFDEVRYIDGHGREILVPLHFSPRSKWLEQLQSYPDLDTLGYDTILPRMAFEMTGLNFAPERQLNPLNRIDDVMNEDESDVYMFNRVPYDFVFDLNIATMKYEDCLKIIEQIIPFFTPELTLTINDKEDFGLQTNVPIILNSVGSMIDYEGPMDSRRMVMMTLNFTAKGFLYSRVRSAARIKKAITEYHWKDFDQIFERLSSEVIPHEANKSDPHVIVDTHETVRKDT